MNSLNKLDEGVPRRKRDESGSFTSEISDGNGEHPMVEETPFLMGGFGMDTRRPDE
jgi:hypothetical protein